MAVQPRISRVRVTNTLNGWRQWTATAAVQDTAAGSSVGISVTQATSGTAPAEATSLNLKIARTDGSLVRQWSGLSLIGSTQIFWFTADGFQNSAARCGTVEIVLQAISTTTGNVYDVESDGDPNSVPIGWSSETDRGWIRGTTTAEQTLSNIILGGGKNSPAQFGDSLFLSTILAHQSFLFDGTGNETLTHRILEGTTSKRALNATGTQTFNSTFSGTSTTIGRVNSGFTAAETAHTTDATPANAQLSGGGAGTSWPWTDLTTVTTDTLTIDPRITVDHHLQIDDSAYGTPPSGKDVNPKQFVSDALPFISFRLVGARGDGVDELAASETFRDAANLLPAAISRSVTTATVNTEAGWAPTLSSTQQSKPGGAYNHVVTVTSSDASGLTSGGTETYTMLRGNPSIGVLVSGGPLNQESHVYAGGPFVAVVSLVDGGTGQRVSATAADVALIRLQTAGANEGYAEYLAADGLTWVTLSSTDVADDEIYFHPCPETAEGSEVFEKTWTDTSTWDAHDILIIGRVTDASGTPYVQVAKEGVVGAHHDHSVEEAAVAANEPQLDAVALAMHGIVSMR